MVGFILEGPKLIFDIRRIDSDMFG